MALPPLDQRDTTVLETEAKKLTATANAIEEIGRVHNIPALGPLAEKVRTAVDAIQSELSGRTGE
jgi:hypothetical protein